MGWRDRDWAKFTDDERAALFGGGRSRRSLPPSAEGSTHRSQPFAPARPSRGVGKRREQVGAWILAALVGVGMLTFAYEHFGNGKHVQSVSLQPVLPLSASPPRIRTVTAPPPADVVAIRWRAQDLAPAPQAGRICVTTATHGRICASYVVGERPADTLTRQIEAMGLRVESNGSG